MRFFTQLKDIILEKVAGNPNEDVEGRVVFDTSAGQKRVKVGRDATNVTTQQYTELIQRERLSGSDGLTAEPITPQEGGTGKTQIDMTAANIGDVLTLNATKTGYDFLPPGGVASLPNFAYYFIDTPEVITIPDGQVMYLINDEIVVDGTLVVDGIFQQLKLPSEYDGCVSVQDDVDLNTAISNTPVGGSIAYLQGIFPVVAAPQTVSKQHYIEGRGNSCIINGDLTFSAGSDGSSLKNVKVDGNITIDAGVKNLVLTDFWVTAGNTVIDNSGVTSNLILGVEEE